jgi:hypothetical protein
VRVDRNLAGALLLLLSFFSLPFFSTFSLVVLERHAQNQFASTLLDSYQATIVNDYNSSSTSSYSVHFFFFFFLTDWDRHLSRLNRKRERETTVRGQKLWTQRLRSLMNGRMTALIRGRE